MMHIKCKVDRSPLHGVGVFTEELVKKGQVIYSESPLLDVNITKEQFDVLAEKEKAEVRYFGFWVEDKKVWHVDFSIIHFVNHSFEPTSTSDFTKPNNPLLALRDLKVGEEVTQNYLEFESKEVLRSRGISVD